MTPHLHLVVAEAQWEEDGTVVPVAAPSDEDVARILARDGARGAVAESRVRRLEDGQYEYTPKKGTAFPVTAAALVRRLVALLPPQRLHLTSFHGGYIAANADGQRGTL